MADKPNICAVGDWKQSIYSFQYAEVENIQEFSQRIQRFKDELNKDSERVIFDVGKVEKIALEKNYRSTQDILDLSEVSLELEGNRYEEVEKQQITSLQSEKDSKDSTIEKFRSEDEAKAILSKIQKIVEDSEYTYGDGKKKRDIGYDDIAVLTRTRSLGLELQQKARENGIPAAYEAGLELFKTNPSIVLLAWLRIINSNSRGLGGCT